MGLEKEQEKLSRMWKYTIDVVYTWKYGGPHIQTTICVNEMKLYVDNAYVLLSLQWDMAALWLENSFETTKSNSLLLNNCW